MCPFVINASLLDCVGLYAPGLSYFSRLAIIMISANVNMNAMLLQADNVPTQTVQFLHKV